MPFIPEHCWRACSTSAAEATTRRSSAARAASTAMASTTARASSTTRTTAPALVEAAAVGHPEVVPRTLSDAVVRSRFVLG